MILFVGGKSSCSKNLFLYYVLLVFAESTPLSNGLLLHSWVFPEPSRKNMTLRRICHFYKVSFGKTSHYDLLIFGVTLNFGPMGHEFWLCGYKCVQTTLFYLFLSKSNFMNPISYEGYPPSFRLCFAIEFT